MGGDRHPAAHHGRPPQREGGATTPLIYQPEGDAYVVVASKGGADDHPAWYKNLQANPEVKVQVKGDKSTARARTATPEEKPSLWRKMTSVWPQYDEYRQKTRPGHPQWAWFWRRV